MWSNEDTERPRRTPDRRHGRGHGRSVTRSPVRGGVHSSGALIFMAGALLAGCPGSTDSASNAQQAATSVLDEMPDADLSTLRKVEKALDSLGDQGGFSTILDDPEDASFGQDEMMDMALMGLGFAEVLAEGESPSDDDSEAAPEWTPAESCASLKAGLEKKGLACPVVQCTSSGTAFKNTIRGDCEGQDSRGGRFTVRGESVMEGTFDKAAGRIEVRLMDKGFEVVFDRNVALEDGMDHDDLDPEGSAPRSSGPGPNSIAMQESFEADGEVGWEAQGLVEGSLDFSAEVDGQLTAEMGFRIEVGGKTESGAVQLKSTFGHKVRSKPEQSTFDARYAQECDAKTSSGAAAAGSVSNEESGSVDRHGSTLTLAISGRHGDTGVAECMETPSNELRRLMEGAYGGNSAMTSESPARRLPGFLRPHRNHRSHSETEEEDMALNGKFSFRGDAIVANPEVCKREPSSGALSLTTAAQSADVAFDGGTMCDGSAGLKINGEGVGAVETYDFLPLGTSRDSDR